MIKSLASPLIGSLTASDIRYADMLSEFHSPTVRKKRNAPKQREINDDVLNTIDSGGDGGGEAKIRDLESTKKAILDELDSVYRSKLDKNDKLLALSSRILRQNLNELIGESGWPNIKLVAPPRVEPLVEPYTVPLVVTENTQRDKLKWENPFFVPSNIVFNTKTQKPSNDYYTNDDEYRDFYVDGADFGKKPITVNKDLMMKMFP